MPIEINNDKPQITIAEFVNKSPAELELTVLAGENGLKKRKLDSERIQKLGLALTGFSHYIHAGRVQITAPSQLSFLEPLSHL